MFEDRCGNHGIEDDGHLRGLGFTRTEAAQRAFGRNLADMLGRFEFREHARDREPIVALHRSIFGLRNRNGGDGAIRAAEFANEAMRVGQDFVASSGVKRSAFGILDARIEVERSFFGTARVIDAVGAGERIHVFVIEIEIAGERA